MIAKMIYSNKLLNIKRPAQRKCGTVTTIPDTVIKKSSKVRFQELSFVLDNFQYNKETYQWNINKDVLN